MARVPAAALLALALACGEEMTEPATGPSGDAAGEVRAELESLREGLGGRVRVSVTEGRVSLDAEEALRGAILRKLANQVGFELISDALPPARLTLHMRDQPLEAVLAALLPGVAFRAEYRFDDERGEHVVARVVAGDFSEPTPEGRAADSPPSSGTAVEEAERDDRAARIGRWRVRRRERMDPEELRLLRERSLARDELFVSRLGDESAEVRVEAVSEVDMEGPGRDRVYALAEGDPDPAVRAAAVSRLIDDHSLAGLEATYRALGDPDPVVVLEAIEAIETAGDESSVPYLLPLVEQHTDEEVREAAKEAAEFLE
jgi:hypothetical protein